MLDASHVVGSELWDATIKQLGIRDLIKLFYIIRIQKIYLLYPVIVICYHIPLENLIIQFVFPSFLKKNLFIIIYVTGILV